ncbi:hypothetical protein LOK49_LG15G01131 [Camellia lanceoleosa]|uniref:Uncharacterized protein n=1 Tax=Camellia lanceoleosa TaxID=1840588 RepID=A0ACC0F3H7_9ERIC|nr:hypothetical protein LOK49_LG15G01131 [Camellia lanceoleosa]
MYRSNISGLISTVLELELRDGHIRQLQKTLFWVMIDDIRVYELDPRSFKKCDATVQCGKLVGTITECQILKLATAANEPKECGRISMDVDPAKVCNGRGAVVEIDDVGNVEPSFNCWQPDTTNGKVSGSGNVTSRESAQQSACPAGQHEHVGITELEIVENKVGIEDLLVDFAHGNVLSTVAVVEGTCSPRNAQSVSGGNVIDAYATMLTEMHKMVSGIPEYVGTSYIYTSVCSKQWVADHHNKFVKPRVTAEGVRVDLFDGSFVSVMDCPQQVPESSDCGIFMCFIIRQYIRGAEVNTMMDGLIPTGLRATMVDMFLSNPER